MFLNKIIIIVIGVITVVLSTILAMVPTCRIIIKRSSSSCYNHGGIVLHKLQCNINIDDVFESYQRRRLNYRGLILALYYHPNQWIELIMQKRCNSSGRSRDDDHDDDVSLFRSIHALSSNTMIIASGSAIVAPQSRHVHRWKMMPYLPSQEVCSNREEGCSDDCSRDKHRTTRLSSIISLVPIEAYKSLCLSSSTSMPSSSWLSLSFPFFTTTQLHAIITSSLLLFAYKKENLPEKICVVCKRPFTWRKKWRKDWDEVKYCSQRCRMAKSDVVK